MIKYGKRTEVCGIPRGFIRANCQRMKHELAKRDGSAPTPAPETSGTTAMLRHHWSFTSPLSANVRTARSAVPREHPMNTRTHKHTGMPLPTPIPLAHWHTQCHNWPAKAAKLNGQASGGGGGGGDEKGKTKKILQASSSICISLCLHVRKVSGVLLKQRVEHRVLCHIHAIKLKRSTNYALQSEKIR